MDLETLVRLSDDVASVVEEVKKNIDERRQANVPDDDDQIFSPFTRLLIRAAAVSGYSICIEASRDIEESLRKCPTFEEIHKGAFYYNTGLCRLRSGDMDYALFYFKLAENEDRKNRGVGQGYSLFRQSEPFEKAFKVSVFPWLDKFLSSFDSVSVDPRSCLPGTVDTVDRMVDQVLGLEGVDVHMILCIGKLFRYNFLDDTTEGSRQLYYLLAADFCRMFEAVAKKQLVANLPQSSPNSINDILVKTLDPLCDDLSGSGAAQVKYRQLRARPHSQFASAGGGSQIDCFNGRLVQTFSGLISHASPEDRLAHLLEILRESRNKLSHDVNPENICFQDAAYSKDVIRCVLVLMHFSGYL